MTPVRSGVRLGIDVGRARIGVARSDPHAMLASPLETVRRDERGHADIERIMSLAADVEAMELVVGLPIGLSGHRTASTDDAEQFAQQLAAAGALPVRLVDERLSTTQAQGQLRAAGKKTKHTRGVIDQAAAVVILQHALDTERSRGEAPGTVVAGPTAAPEADTLVEGSNEGESQ